MAAQEVILGLAECFTAAELTAFLKQALADLANGVRTTSIQLDGGGGSGKALEGDPERVVAMLRRAKQLREANGDSGAGLVETQAAEPPMGSIINFSTRPART